MDPHRHVEEASPSQQSSGRKCTTDPPSGSNVSDASEKLKVPSLTPYSKFPQERNPSLMVDSTIAPNNVSSKSSEDIVTPEKTNWRPIPPMYLENVHGNVSSQSSEDLVGSENFVTPEKTIFVTLDKTNQRHIPPMCPSVPRKQKNFISYEATRELEAREKLGALNYRLNPFFEKLMQNYYEDVPQRRGFVDMDYPANGTKEDLRFEKDFVTISVITKGTFSTVYKVLNRVEGCIYAMKKVTCDPRGDHESNRQALVEVQALTSLGIHDNIVRYYNSFYENGAMFIQLELCDHNLKSLKPDKKIFASQKTLLNIIYQIAVALEFIHKRGIVHMNVSPSKIYLQNDIFKLGGFRYAVGKDKLCDIKTKGLDTRYAAPEILDENIEPKELDVQLLDRIDIYSLGATVYSLGRGFEAQHAYTHSFEQLVRGMMRSAPSSRPTAKDLLMILGQEFEIYSATPISIVSQDELNHFFNQS